MSGETETSISAWTVDSLHAHILGLIRAEAKAVSDLFSAAEKANEQRFIATEKANEQRFIAQEKAVDAALTAAKTAVDAALTAADRATAKAELAAERRFEAVNEFRAQLADQASTLITRTEVNTIVRGLTEKFELLLAALNQLASTSMPRPEVETRLTVLNERAADNTKRLDTTAGHRGGVDASWAMIALVFVVIGSISGVVIYLATH